MFPAPSWTAKKPGPSINRSSGLSVTRTTPGVVSMALSEKTFARARVPIVCLPFQFIVNGGTVTIFRSSSSDTFSRRSRCALNSSLTGMRRRKPSVSTFARLFVTTSRCVSWTSIAEHAA